MISLIIALLFLGTNPTNPQSCNPAAVSYIVRDDAGNIINEADLRSIVERLPKVEGDAGSAYADQVSFADDQVHYYWRESVDWSKGKKQQALEFANAAECTLHLTEVTLTYHEQKMRLIFNIDIARFQKDRRLVVDGLPFEEGTFRLDIAGWKHEEDLMIPAERWKRVKTNDRRSPSKRF